MKIDIGQLEFIDQKLRNVLMWIESTFGVEPIITSLYRIGDNGVHGTLPLRGTDIRTRNKGVGEAMEKEINDKWVYDPERTDKKVAFLHGLGANLHLHIQVHPNTRAR